MTRPYTRLAALISFISILFCSMPAGAFVTGISNAQPNPLTAGSESSFTVQVNATLTALAWGSTAIYIDNQFYACVMEPNPGLGPGSGDVSETITVPVMAPLDTPGTYAISAEDFEDLDCQSTGAGNDASTDIEVISGTTFTITKDFTNNSATATADIGLTCEDGVLSPPGTQTLQDGEQAVFQVSGFAVGTTACEVTETVSGYDASFVGDCTVDPIVSGSNYQCTVVNTPNPATFEVSKVFTDGDNPTEVEVTISCFTGLPLIQSQTISTTQGVKFIVDSFADGELDCSITEEELPGYTPDYAAGGPGPFDNIDGCNFDDVGVGAENTCVITNNADPVTLVIEKDWIIDGIGGDQVDQYYRLALYCDAEIVGVPYLEDKSGYIGCGGAFKVYEEWDYCIVLEGFGDGIFTPQVIPEWPSSNCWVEETVFESGVEVDNGCGIGSLEISAGQGNSCLITNTVFFEGIPTLSHYGMALLALLMLGLGMVAFRRFS